RSVKREACRIPVLADESALSLGERFQATGTSPSNRAARREVSQRVQAAVLKMPDSDREVLLLRFVEQLSASDTAAILDISEVAVRTRQSRALTRLTRLLGIGPKEDGK